MLLCHPLLSYLLLVIGILATSGRGASLCRQDQSAALLRLKAGFRFNTISSICMWFPYEAIDCLRFPYEETDFLQFLFETKTTNLSSWKTDTNCCTWEGVTCDGMSGYVTALDLSRLCLSGNLNSTDIFKLTSLRSLNLAFNNFDGSPWPSLGFEQLTDLEYLDLSYSGLSGTLPVENGQLSNVVTLNLSGLDLKDLNLETLIDSLRSLQQLHLDNVINISFSPTDFAYASSTNTTSGLKELSMCGCTITSGRFHTFLTGLLFRSKLANLVMLKLSDFDPKKLSFHSLIGSLGNLQALYLGNVNISVSPTDLAHASSTNISSRLKVLTIRQCTITGGHIGTVLTNPQFHSMLTNLVTLEISGYDLKNLSLHGLIDSFGNLQNLYLDNVDILVSPTDLTHASSTNTTSGLKELRMVRCTITGGRFDTALTNKLPFFSKLSLDGTNITGPAPVLEFLAEFPSLSVLSLYSCGLTGKFPSWIFRIKSLMSLDMSGNENLHGELPEFIEGSALQELMLSGSKFSGKIPKSISNIRNLTKLDLSNCQFHGPIPSFAQWPMIRWVHLSGNNLTGSLPSDGYLSLHNLTSVTLSNNSISGGIPASLFSHPSLVDLDLSQNNFTGNFLLYPTISSSLRWIDVSFNKLQGPHPKLLSKFVGLYWLDLSSNNLNGTVDLIFINNYKELYYLSLSNNKLSVVEEDGNRS